MAECGDRKAPVQLPSVACAQGSSFASQCSYIYQSTHPKCDAGAAAPSIGVTLQASSRGTGRSTTMFPPRAGAFWARVLALFDHLFITSLSRSSARLRVSFPAERHIRAITDSL